MSDIKQQLGDATVKGPSTASAATDFPLVVALHPSSPVALPTLTKSTQGITGVSTQALKDSGRVGVAITCFEAAGIITTEALFAAGTFAITRDGATATTGVQLAVTTGKRFVIQSIMVTVKNNAAVATASTSKLVLRYSGVGGTITNTSPILSIFDIGTGAAGAYIGPFSVPFPDGLELISASTFGFTNLSNAATMVHTIVINGFEY